MGLFDRFKRQAKEAVDSKKITIEEGTVEAEEIIQKREELLSKIKNSKRERSERVESNDSVNDTDDQWDDFSDEIEINPFSKEQDKKSRKIAQKTEKIYLIK
jgi:hypothetical protein